MRNASRPDFPPMPEFAADGTVHILPSTMPENSTLGDSRPNRWTQRGFGLKALIANLYRMDESRVEFADAGLAAQRYDVSVATPGPESEETMGERVKDALRTGLHLAIAPETRTMDVYIVSSPHGPVPGMKPATARGVGGSGLTLSLMRSKAGDDAEREETDWSGWKITSGEVTSGSLSVGGPVKLFCSELERVLDRPVVDESGLTGAYEIRVRWEKLDQAGFFRRLHEKLGLVVTPGRSPISLLVVRGE